jgi:hypothetical protein
MIEHNFNFLITEHNVFFTEEFKNHIENIKLDEYKIQSNSFFQEENNQKKELREKINFFLDPILQKFNSIIGNVWIQKYSFGQYHDLHIHSNINGLSFIWYIVCSEKSSNTFFYNPGYPYIQTHTLEIKPEIGKFIVFNGCIPHCVMPNKDDKRIVISGNLIYK